jgi:outer membrane protein OmpA-like peptidoglycan-associated protein
MRRRRSPEEEDASFWVSFSDVATALLMAFLLIMVILMSKQQNEAKRSNEQNVKINEQNVKIKGEIMPYVQLRRSLIEELGQELNKNSIKVEVDKKTGEIKLRDEIFFDEGKSEIKKGGLDWLKKFMPVYFGVLLDDKYKDYVSSIGISGHANYNGTYESNMDLTHKRANAVWDYFLKNMPKSWGVEKIGRWKKLISVNGRSYVDPVLKPDGSPDPEKSRRVTFRFSLKEDQMIDRIIDALNLNG